MAAAVSCIHGLVVFVLAPDSINHKSTLENEP